MFTPPFFSPRVHKCTRRQVSAVEEGSPAAHAGLRPGDAVAAIEGQSTVGMTHAAAVAIVSSANERVRLDLHRGGGRRNSLGALRERPLAVPEGADAAGAAAAAAVAAAAEAAMAEVAAARHNAAATATAAAAAAAARSPAGPKEKKNAARSPAAAQWSDSEEEV
jgi:predicted metalloprotease with PDZ domain